MRALYQLYCAGMVPASHYDRAAAASAALRSALPAAAVEIRERRE
jgi:hypothetical protein